MDLEDLNEPKKVEYLSSVPSFPGVSPSLVCLDDRACAGDRPGEG